MQLFWAPRNYLHPWFRARPLFPAPENPLLHYHAHSEDGKQAQTQGQGQGQATNAIKISPEFHSLGALAHEENSLVVKFIIMKPAQYTHIICFFPGLKSLLQRLKNCSGLPVKLQREQLW